MKFPARLLVVCAPRSLRGEALIRTQGEALDLAIRVDRYAPVDVAGVVRDASGRTLPSAGLIALRREHYGPEEEMATRADSQGRFRFAGLWPDATYEIVPVMRGVSGPGAEVLTRPGRTVSLDVVMPDRAAVLAGAVRDPSGQPIAGAWVMYTYRGNALYDSGQAMTDASGAFEATGLVPGSYFVRVTCRGFGVWQDEVSTSDPPRTITLPRTRWVSFDLRDRFGLPLDAEVRGHITRVLDLGVECRDDTGRCRVQVPETETELEIEVRGDSSPPVTRHLDWPPEGDLDLGTIILDEG
jgi:hypothetical protein